MTHRRCLPLLIGLLAIVCVNVAMVTSLEARPKYKAVFEKVYTSFKKTDCTICHPTKDSKKARNHYGEALQKELQKNETDEKKIEEALKAIEDGECSTGKWKPRLEKGQAPCTDKGRDLSGGGFLMHLLDRADHSEDAVTNSRSTSTSLLIAHVR